VLAGVTHPFGAVRTVRVGEPIELSGRCVVFSNELFDAQPCRRFVRRAGTWRELGVAERDGRLVELELGGGVGSWLPTQAPEGYGFDAPRAAADLAARIAAQPWSGLFLAFDYGKSWPALAEETPAGTARAYHRHTQSNDLLARPGEQDLTCHVCWDWLRDALVEGGFAAPQLESQEAFFVRHAAEYLAAATAAEGARFSPKKLSLLQLLHPAHLGQKFQALHAWRG
jgi:SAM-dependent MidA family methyltransferase